MAHKAINNSRSKLPAPNCFDLPDKYTEWRPYQEQAVLNAVDNPLRFTTQICPTGFGKSLLCIATALLKGGRAVYLTSTKGLQKQLLNDFASVGMVDIRGRNAYPCRYVTDGSHCDHGPCVAGFKCPLKGGGCLYYDAYAAASKAPFVVTNYSYWMSINEYGEGLGYFDTIICDEAHDTPDLVSSFLTVTINTADAFVGSLLKGGWNHYTINDWKVWAKSFIPAVDTEIEYYTRLNLEQGGLSRDQRKELVKMRSLKKSMEVISNIHADWVWESVGDKVSFSPVWPAPYCENVLFRDIPNVVLTSATVNLKTVDMLGVMKSDNMIYEYPHTFPIGNRLLTHIPTVRLNYRSGPADINKMLLRIDQIIGPRLDRKGIIHSTSYERRDLIIARSKHRDIMMTHKNRNTEFMVEQFKEADPPRVFVSPAVTTGYDFYGDMCEYQIIVKLPYPDTRNNIMRERVKRDKDYAPYITMQQLVQAVGRPVRSPTDRCESFITDDNIGWFMKVYDYLAPIWFKGAFVQRTVIPPPAPKINNLE